MTPIKIRDCGDERFYRASEADAEIARLKAEKEGDTPRMHKLLHAWNASSNEKDARIAGLERQLAEALRALTQISTMIAEMDDSAEYYFWHQFEDIDKVARTGLAGQPPANVSGDPK